MRPDKTSLLFLLLIILPFLSVNSVSNHFLFSTENPGIESPGLSDLVLESRIARLNEYTPIQLDFNASVKEYIELFTSTRKKDMERILGYSGLYFPMIETQLDKHQLPFEIKYLAVLESGLDPFAVSPSGAVGLWQFLLHSARMFNLEVNSFVDERLDPVKSTEAACRYLVYLYHMFGDWHLAFAAYNGGPGVVRTAIERSDGKTDFWDIQEYLPEQTRKYVPAFIAIVYIMSYYSDHDLVPLQIPGIFEKTDTVWVRQPVSFHGLSQALNISVDILSMLNPAFKTGYIPSAGEKVAIVLPSENIIGFYNLESNIYSSSRVNETSRQLSVNQSNVNLKMLTHRVERGEFLHKIAVKYRSTPEQIREWNELKGDIIYEGQELILWIPEDFTEVLNNSEFEQKASGKSLFLK